MSTDITGERLLHKKGTNLYLRASGDDCTHRDTLQTSPTDRKYICSHLYINKIQSTSFCNEIFYYCKHHSPNIVKKGKTVCGRRGSQTSENHLIRHISTPPFTNSIKRSKQYSPVKWRPTLRVKSIPSRRVSQTWVLSLITENRQWGHSVSH